MAVTIGPITLPYGAQLVPVKYKSRTRQTAELAGDASVVVSGSNIVERFYAIRCKISRTLAEQLTYYIENSLRFQAEVCTVTDGLGVTRQVRYWDDETDYTTGGGGFTELEMIFREEVNA